MPFLLRAFALFLVVLTLPQAKPQEHCHQPPAPERHHPALLQTTFKRSLAIPVSVVEIQPDTSDLVLRVRRGEPQDGVAVFASLRSCLVSTRGRLAELVRRNVAAAVLRSLGLGSRTFWLLGGLLLLCLLSPIIALLFAHTIGRIIKSRIEDLDQDFLGVDIDIGNMTVDVFHGDITMEHLVVHNPPGYHVDYLLRAETVDIDIDMATFIFSGMKHASVEKLIFKNVDVIYAKKFTTSNVHDILEHLNKDQPKPSASHDNLSLPASPETESKSDFKVTLQQVHIQDVGAKAAADICAGGVGARIAIADINYEDFSQEVGEKAMAKTAAKILLKSVLKSAIATIVGKSAADKMM